jgi:predicted dehydrogenase
MRSIYRRDWLRYVGGLSATALTAKTELFADASPAFVAKSTEKLRVAVIGFRSRGLDHIKGFTQQNDCVVTAICDCDEAELEKAMNLIERSQAGWAAKYVKDLRRVFEDRTIDAVSIATPNHWHALAAVWAMQAGKDVYVEKPVSHNVWEGRRIVEASRKYKRICQAGTQCRSMAGLRAAIAFLHEGKLGPVKRAYGLCYKNRPSIGKVDGEGVIPKSCDYDLWCGPAPFVKVPRIKLHYDWHWQWDWGNGDLGNQGVHQIDIARWGLNKSGLPKSVQSYGGRYGYEDDGQTPNTQVCFFDYGDCDFVFEVRGLPSRDFLADRNDKSTEDTRRRAKVGVVFHAKDGVLVIPSYTDAIALTNDGEVIKVFGTPKDHEFAHYANFVQAVRSRKAGDLNADIAEGHKSSALCHMANISYRLGRDVPMRYPELSALPVAEAVEIIQRMRKHMLANQVSLDSSPCHLGLRLAIDAANEMFVDNKRADAMLRREYRKGFEVPDKG